MMRRVVAVVVCATVLAAACTDDGESGDDSTATTGTADTAPTAPAEVAEVEWGACPFQVPAGTEIDCGTLDVPADHDDPDGDTVTLALGVVRSQADEVAEDPVVYLSGGPGQAALELVPMAFGPLYEPLTENRDLVIVDQRGTGYSEPSLACDEYTNWLRETLGSELSSEEMAEQAAARLDECRQRLLDEGIDLSHYNSAASATDLEHLRRALGHDQWNLYGVSYGTRLAQAVMRHHPDGIRSVVLDAAYPAAADLYEEVPANAARAIEELFALCESDPACQERYPEVDETFRSLVDELDQNPAPVTVVDAETGQRFDGELDGDALVGFVFQSLYSTELLAFLPEIIDQVSNGETGTVGLLLGALIQQANLVSIGMQLGVQCQEEVPFGEQSAAEEAASEHPLLEGFLGGAATLGPGVFDLCGAWDAGSPPEAANEPVESDLPALVLAGQVDPITPPTWGEEVAEQLAESVVVVFPFTGHGSLGSHDCARRITQAFLDDPGTEPDDACVDDVPPPAFTPESIEVEIEPFSSDELGISGVRPAGWPEVLPGTFQDSPLVALTQQVVPGVTSAQLLQQVAAQMGADEPPPPVGQLETEALTWELYEIDDLGQRVDLALAEHEGTLLVVQMVSTPERRDVYISQVFQPAVEAFQPEM